MKEVTTVVIHLLRCVIQYRASDFSLISHHLLKSCRYAGVFILVALSPLLVYAGAEDRRYEDERLKLSAEIYDILMRQGKCSSVADCQNMQPVFVSPRTGGITVQIWGIDDSIVLQSIAVACMTVFFRNTSIETISMDIYSIRKKDALALPMWKLSRPIQMINFERKH